MRDGVFPDRNKRILVAVAFDDRLEALLEAAERIGRATGAVLRLVHVCDPWTKSLLATAVEVGPIDLVQTLKDEAVRVATRRLEQVAASFPASVEVETEVLSGDLVRSIAADAEANDVGLILIGTRKGSAAGTSLGFSTAVSLIMEATVPVMVLNEEARFKPKGEGLSVLVADDFSDVSSEALKLGFALARRWQRSTLYHVHVEGASDLQDLKKAVKIDERSVVTPEQVEFLHRQAEERMLARSADGPSQLEAAGGAYRLEIVSGGVADELEKSAIAARADVAVFGQHRVFHRQTMHVGQVPFKAMLGQNRPIVVVPVQ